MLSASQSPSTPCFWVFVRSLCERMTNRGERAEEAYQLTLDALQPSLEG